MTAPVPTDPAGHGAVFFEFPSYVPSVQGDIDDSGAVIQLRSRWLAPPIARWSGVAQHLAHRPSRQAKPFGGLALTQPFDKDTAPYLSV